MYILNGVIILVYPFTLQVTGMKRENALVDGLDYQIPVTRLTKKGLSVKTIGCLRGFTNTPPR